MFLSKPKLDYALCKLLINLRGFISNLDSLHNYIFTVLLIRFCVEENLWVKLRLKSKLQFAIKH